VCLNVLYTGYVACLYYKSDSRYISDREKVHWSRQSCIRRTYTKLERGKILAAGSMVGVAACSGIGHGDEECELDLLGLLLGIGGHGSGLWVGGSRVRRCCVAEE